MSFLVNNGSVGFLMTTKPGYLHQAGLVPPHLEQLSCAGDEGRRRLVVGVGQQDSLVVPLACIL